MLGLFLFNLTIFFKNSWNFVSLQFDDFLPKKSLKFVSLQFDDFFTQKFVKFVSLQFVESRDKNWFSKKTSNFLPESFSLRKIAFEFHFDVCKVVNRKFSFALSRWATIFKVLLPVHLILLTRCRARLKFIIEDHLSYLWILWRNLLVPLKPLTMTVITLVSLLRIISNLVYTGCPNKF